MPATIYWKVFNLKFGVSFVLNQLQLCYLIFGISVERRSGFKKRQDCFALSQSNWRFLEKNQKSKIKNQNLRWTICLCFFSFILGSRGSIILEKNSRVYTLFVFKKKDFVLRYFWYFYWGSPYYTPPPSPYPFAFMMNALLQDIKVMHILS